MVGRKCKDSVTSTLGHFILLLSILVISRSFFVQCTQDNAFKGNEYGLVVENETSSEFQYKGVKNVRDLQSEFGSLMKSGTLFLCHNIVFIDGRSSNVTIRSEHVFVNKDSKHFYIVTEAFNYPVKPNRFPQMYESVPFTITMRSESLAFDVPLESKEDGTIIKLHPYHANANQRFFFKNLGDTGYFHIVSNVSNLCLQVEELYDPDRLALAQYPCDSIIREQSFMWNGHNLLYRDRYHKRTLAVQQFKKVLYLKPFTSSFLQELRLKVASDELHDKAKEIHNHLILQMTPNLDYQLKAALLQGAALSQFSYISHSFALTLTMIATIMTMVFMTH